MSETPPIIAGVCHPCPHCGGRGWTALSDDELLTEACAPCAEGQPETALADPHWQFILAALSGNVMVAEAAWQKITGGH